MYRFLVILQIIGICIFLGELMFVINRPSTKQTVLFVVIIVCCLANQIGYHFELHATNLDTALLAVKFQYTGKLFIMVTMFYFIMNYCKRKYTLMIAHALYSFDMIVLGLVYTCDKTKFFYTSIEFVEDGLFPHLVVGHAMGYYLFLASSITYSVIILYVLISQIKRTDSLAEKHKLNVLLSMIVIPICGMVAFIFGWGYPYDPTALSYLSVSLIMMFGFMRDDIFDPVELAMDSIFDTLKSSYFVVDREYNLLRANDEALKQFPMITSPGYVQYLMEMKPNEPIKMLSGNTIEYHYQELTRKGKLLGYVVGIEDITSEYEYMSSLEQEVVDKVERLDEVHKQLVLALANVIEARDNTTGQHVTRTSIYVSILANALLDLGYYTDQVNELYIEDVVRAAPLHDVGKIAIPDSILLKPDKLTDAEFEVIKTHTVIGGEMLADLLKDMGEDSYLRTAYDMALNHHEKWNGKGYPNGIAGEDIPLSARIMAVADVYDALRNDRPYKKAFTCEEAANIIIEESGKAFDPLLVEAFVHSRELIENTIF